MEQYYQAIERLSDAFWPTTEAGELLTEGQARQIIADVVQRLNTLDLGLKFLIKQVRKA